MACLNPDEKPPSTEEVVSDFIDFLNHAVDPYHGTIHLLQSSYVEEY